MSASQSYMQLMGMGDNKLNEDKQTSNPTNTFEQTNQVL